MEGEPLLAGWRKLSRRKQWLIAAGVLVLAFTGIGAVSGGGDDTADLAETVDIFTPPPQPKRRAEAEAQPQSQPKPLDSLQQARYLHFQDPRFTAKFMAEYLNSGPAFDDVFYGVATPFEITLHGNLHGSRFDLRLYKVGRQRVLMKNCMMGSCYSEWAGALVGHEPAQRRRAVSSPSTGSRWSSPIGDAVRRLHANFAQFDDGGGAVSAPDLASYLRIEERELEAGGVN